MQISIKNSLLSTAENLTRKSYQDKPLGTGTSLSGALGHITSLPSLPQKGGVTMMKSRLEL
jgi:hypothetical protein